MPPAKNLTAHVLDGTFRARRHRSLLTGPVVPWPALAAIQSQYAATTHELERRKIAVDFERAVREAPESTIKTALTELDRIVGMPPMRIDPKNREVSLRFARALWARDLRRGGLTLTAVAGRLGVSRATLRRYLNELDG